MPKCLYEWEDAVVRFTDNFVALTFVACSDVIFDLRVNAFPVEVLGDRVDSPSDSRVSQVGVIPVDDLLLETCRYNDFAIDGVHRGVSKCPCSESVIGGVLLSCFLDFIIFVLFLFDEGHCQREIKVGVAVEFIDCVDF